jgi:hypothetical protein
MQLRLKSPGLFLGIDTLVELSMMLTLNPLFEGYRQNTPYGKKWVIVLDRPEIGRLMSEENLYDRIHSSLPSPDWKFEPLYGLNVWGEFDGMLICSYSQEE